MSVVFFTNTSTLQKTLRIVHIVMRTYLTHTEYIYICIYIHTITYIFIYRKYIRNLFFNHLYVASLRQLLLVVQRYVPEACIIDIPALPEVDPPERFDQYLLHLHDQRCFENPSGSWHRMDSRSVRWVQKISVDFQGKTPWKTGGMVQTRFPFFGWFWGIRSTCHVMLCRLVKKVWIDDFGIKRSIWNTPILKFNKKTLRFNKSLWPTLGSFWVLPNHPKKQKSMSETKNAPGSLVAGFNPSEKYSSKWVHLPQFSGWK